MEHRTVLVVDDEPIVLRIVQKRLSHKEHVRVLIAETGKAGLAILEKEKPDVIILDHLLPDTEGLDLCRTIKRNPKFKDIPILFFASFNKFGFEASAEAAGALRVINKEDMSELIAAIHELANIAHPGEKSGERTA